MPHIFCVVYSDTIYFMKLQTSLRVWCVPPPPPPLFYSSLWKKIIVKSTEYHLTIKHGDIYNDKDTIGHDFDGTSISIISSQNIETWHLFEIILEH